MQAVLKAQINKTDRNDARGMAQMMRVALYRPVHAKTLRSQKLRTLLTHRKLLQSKVIAIENDLRGTLRNFGLKIGMVGKVKFEGRIKEAAQSMLDSKKWSWLTAWAMQIAKRRGMKKAIAALARRLAVIMHRIYGPAVRCKGIRTEWSFWSAPHVGARAPGHHGCPHTPDLFIWQAFVGHRCIQVSGALGGTVVPSVSNHLADPARFFHSF